MSEPRVLAFVRSEFDPILQGPCVFTAQIREEFALEAELTEDNMKIVGGLFIEGGQ